MPKNGIYDSLDKLIYDYSNEQHDIDEDIQKQILKNSGQEGLDQMLAQLKTYNISQHVVEANKRNKVILTRNAHTLLDELFNYANTYNGLLYFHTRGDGDCFLNSLFIFILMTQKEIENKTLCTAANIQSECLLMYEHFGYFKDAMIYLAKIHVQNLSYTQEVSDSIIKNLLDPKIPDIGPFINIFNSFFNCNILNVIIDKVTFQLISWAESSTMTQTDDTDHVIIINQNNIHFCVVMPKDTGDPITYHKLRKKIYEMMREKCISLIPI